MQRDELVDQFIDVYQNLQRSLKYHFFQVLSDENISPAQIGVLFLIERQQPISGSDIAKQMFISRSAVTQLIDGLEQAKFVTRSEDKDDRRITYLHLTGSGRAKLKLLHRKRKEVFSKISETLSIDELKRAVAVHSKMIEQIENK